MARISKLSEEQKELIKNHFLTVEIIKGRGAPKRTAEKFYDNFKDADGNVIEVTEAIVKGIIKPDIEKKVKLEKKAKVAPIKEKKSRKDLESKDSSRIIDVTKKSLKHFDAYNFHKSKMEEHKAELGKLFQAL